MKIVFAMNMRTNDLAHGNESIFDSIFDGLYRLEELGFGIAASDEAMNQPTILFYYPIAQGNPFQSLYYSEFFSNGTLPVGVREIDDIIPFRLPVNAYFHLHWLGGVIGDTENNDVAKSRIADFVKKISTLKSNGVKIVWTVHNILPHDSKLKQAQIDLRVELIKLVDIIHIMNDDTQRLAEPFFEIPSEKIISTPHPSYRRFYPSVVSRVESRFQLDIPQNSSVFIFFGSIQAYKGLEDLLNAFEKLQLINPEIYLLIAGKVVNKSYFSSLRGRINSNNSIRLIDSRIANENVQYYFSASDYCVCPYRISLNSGVAHLSHTFNIPVIAPNIGGFRTLLEEGGGLLYDNDNLDDLYEVMKTALVTKFNGDDIELIDSKYDFRKVSKDFHDKLVLSKIKGGFDNV
ncbi:MAG: glycosyltransferase [Candidatus Poseidoniales archaeon]|nr:MAG: glycosyltransferase [Candidatus Poseidoniales archaeon]